MSKLTGTHSEASEIDFTTLTTVPGTVKVHGAPIQILDLRTFIAILPWAHGLISFQPVSLRVQTMDVVEVGKVRPFISIMFACSLMMFPVIAGTFLITRLAACMYQSFPQSLGHATSSSSCSTS